MRLRIGGIGCKAHGRRSAIRAMRVIAFTLPAIARAAPPAIDLDWRAPSGCPDRATVRRYVEEMLGRDDGSASSLSARGSAQRTAADRWTADLALRTSSGADATRSFEGPSCEAVSRAAALVMALAIHPNEPPPPPPAEETADRDAGPPPRPIVGRLARP